MGLIIIRCKGGEGLAPRARSPENWNFRCSVDCVAGASFFFRAKEEISRTCCRLARNVINSNKQNNSNKQTFKVTTIPTTTHVSLTS